ncbi:MAG: hypothetical protein JWQ97_3379 [Phenylobacterium sp.]|nr:hypothetical protein [Phenylobacterium sp.]
MMAPGAAFELIATLLEQAQAEDVDPSRLQVLLVSAHTHAVIQASAHRRRAKAALFDALAPALEQATMQ